MINNIIELDTIEYNTCRNTELVGFYIKKINHRKIKQLAKKYKKSKSYILDIILDKINVT